MKQEKGTSNTRTVLEATFRIVSRTLGVPAQIVPFDFDVVRICLMPDEHLLWSLHTFAFILFAPLSPLRRCDRLGRCRINNDVACMGIHVQVWLTAAIGNL
jgi:hypothetical protein